jgi:energy-coupling factor transporter ATP-binding protein EcfA2
LITLERLRLVNWHNFEDETIEIGNRCLLAGDNDSGKSTIIDAIQYVMAANLRMARFNSAAEERRSGGRDLMGYVRCKLGSESTEYRRGDTIAHVMLEWRQTVGEDKAGGTGFACGICIEAYKDNHYTEHFWIGNIGAGACADSIRAVSVRNEKDEPLLFRQFKNILAEKKLRNSILTYNCILKQIIILII